MFDNHHYAFYARIFTAAGRAFGFNPFQQRGGAVFTADKTWVFSTPLGGKFTAEGLRRDRLGEVVDAGQSVVNLFFNGVRVGEELLDAADDFVLFF